MHWVVFPGSTDCLILLRVQFLNCWSVEVVVLQPKIFLLFVCSLDMEVTIVGGSSLLPFENLVAIAVICVMKITP